MNYGNKFYNALFITMLGLVVLVIALYFLGFLEPLGLKYEPDPPPPPTIETAQ